MRSLEVEASPVIVVKNEDATSKLSPNKEEKNPWTAWKVSALVLVLVLMGTCLVAGGWMTQKNNRSVNRKMKINRMRAPDRESIQMLANSDEDDKPNLKNIQFLGKGYNIFTGNPGTRGSFLMDNGYTRPVANLAAGGGKSGYKLTPDKQHTVPVMVSVEDLANCVTQSESTHITGEQSMFAELKETVTVKGGYTGIAFSGSFTGSLEYQRQKEAIYKSDQTFMTATARCAVYVATLSTLFNVTDEFAQAVANLDGKKKINETEMKNENNEYRVLLRDFGTHYLTRMVMGSLYSRTSLFSFSSYQTMSYSKLKVDATAKFEYLKATGEATSLTETQQRAVSNFTAERTAYFEVTRGKKPPSDGNVNTWMESSKETPYPLQFQLEPIQTALSKQYFPGDSDIGRKRENLKSLMNKLCKVSSIVNCNAREMDRNVPINQQQTTTVQGMQTVACPYGYTAISCGIQPDLDKMPELQWSVYQHETDKSKCVCYHAFGAKCFATCVPSDMVKGFSTTVSKRSKTCLQVQKCRKNSLVVGCGIIQYGFFEKTPAVYAADNTSCHCYTCQTSSCVASCATNVMRWERDDQSGATSRDRAWVVKKCPTPGNIALSCGMDTRGKLGGWEKYPAFALTSYNECGAYSEQGVTTKIVCGRFKITTESQKAKYMGRAVLKVTEDSTEVLKGSDEALFLNH